MTLERQLEKTEDSLQMLDNALPQPTVDRFLFGLKLRIKNEEDVMAFTVRIRNSHNYALLENARLNKWKNTFNNEYATDHNKHFTTAEAAMNRMKCTLKGIMDAVIQFCYKSNKQLPANADTPLVLKRSPLLNGPYSKDMFGTDLYGKSVMMLYEELVSFLHTAEENVSICLEVIEIENYLRQHKQEVNQVYAKCFEETIYHNRSVIKRLIEANANTDNDIMKAIEDANDAQQMIADLFHMLNVDQWNEYVVCKAVHDANEMGLDNTEIFLWGQERADQVMRVRTLLAHLSELDMEIEKHEGVVGGEFLLRLFVWCNIKDNRHHSKLLDYVTDKILSAPNCRFKRVARIGAVKAEKKKIAIMDNELVHRMQNEFNESINTFLEQF